MPMAFDTHPPPTGHGPRPPAAVRAAASLRLGRSDSPYLRGWCWAILPLALACGIPVSAEELELAQLKALDWAAKENGAETSAHALIAPTDDPAELVKLLKKDYGLRLSTTDTAHVLVLSPGQMRGAAEYRIRAANIDRVRQVLEIEMELQLADPDAGKSDPAGTPRRTQEGGDPLAAAPTQEVVIQATRPAQDPATKPLEPFARVPAAGGNPTLLVPLGQLNAGRWWLQVTSTLKQGTKISALEPLSRSFLIKDPRGYKEKGGKGRDTPSVGLDKPTSPSVTDGMGGN